MRSILLLLGGAAVSFAGLLVVVGTRSDLAGALLIGAGALLAAIGPRYRLVEHR